MVASGLEGDMTAVAPVKLMLHLTTAAVIYTLIVSVATGLGRRHGFRPPAGAVSGATLLVVLVLAQIALGALVAGSKAGFIWNTWPLMDGDLVPPSERLFSGVPFIENFVDNTMLVQFNHRMTAYLVLIVAVLHAVGLAASMPKSNSARRAFAVAGLVLAQGVIGILTLIWVVPLWAGLLHQAFAFVVLGMAAAHRAALARG
jgi:cytochrome c oxidase assembly protein subunit 15